MKWGSALGIHVLVLQVLQREEDEALRSAVDPLRGNLLIVSVGFNISDCCGRSESGLELVGVWEAVMVPSVDSIERLSRQCFLAPSLGG